MKIHEYNEMMAYLTRPGKAQGGVIGKGGMFQGEDLGYRTGYAAPSGYQPKIELIKNPRNPLLKNKKFPDPEEFNQGGVAGNAGLNDILKL